MKKIIIFAMIVLMTSVVNAICYDLSSYDHVIYVDAVNGNDNSGDGSELNPYKTIQKGVNAITTDNDAIFLKGHSNEDVYTGSKTVTLIGNYLDYNSGLTGHIHGDSENYGTLNAYNLNLIQTDTGSWDEMLYYLYANLHNCVFNDKSGESNVYGVYNFINCLIVEAGSYYSQTNLVDCADANSFSYDPFDFSLTSGNWEHQGTGLNPDGTQANLGVYGGPCAWGDWGSSIVLPTYTNFISFPHTTNLSAVPDLTNVTNLTLETLYGMLQFPHNHSVNAEGKDLDTHIKLGDCYISVNLSGLDSTFNASAYLTLNNSDGHCGGDRIYYAPGVYDSADAIRQHDTVCRDCIKLIADNHKVKFRVYHFSSYAIGSNANLTIYDNYEDSSAQPNANITFYANYTNKSGSHISGATCTIYFDGNTNDKHNMTDNGNNYNYTFLFSSTGTHNYNITCSATNYNTLSAVDDVEVSSVVPEFSGSSFVVISIFVIILGLLLLNRNRK